jgi:hypothetical protein
MKYALYKEVYTGVENVGPYRSSFATPFFVFSMHSNRPVQPGSLYREVYNEWSNFTTVSC